MLRDHFIAFDEDVAASAAYASSDQFNARLGAYDQLVVYVQPYAATLDNWTVSIGLDTSGDGINWVSAGTLCTVINGTFPTSGAAGVWDSGTKPLMQFVRISIASGAGCTGAHLKVYASLRDSGGGKPKQATGGSHVA